MRRHGWFAAVAAVTVLVAGSLTIGGVAAGVPRAATTPTTPTAAATADLELLAHMPDAIRASCLFVDTSYNYKAPGDHYVANLECHPDSATTIEFRQYATASEMDGEFTRFSRFSGSQCAARQPYTISGQPMGEWVCQSDSSSVNIYWTFTPLNVIGLLERSDTDVTAAQTTWNDDAGPVPGVHDVADFVDRSTSQTNGKLLLSEIPAAAKNKCKIVDLSIPGNVLDGPSPAQGYWLDGEVVCRNGGIPTVTIYRHYRDEDAYTFAYDPTTYLQYAEPRDSTCADGYESSWKVKGEEVGRIACYLSGAPPKAEAHLLWTYDPQLIVGEAYSLNQKSTKATFDWWENSSGPVE